MAGKKARRFNPSRVAYFEANGWRAYYDRKWLRLLRLMLQINQEQFGIPFPLSILAGYYVARAARAWAPLDHNQQEVLKYYEKFYRMAHRFSGLEFDPRRVAELELEYNDVHRKLVGQEDKAEFIATMVKLHSTLFGISPEQAQASAEWRVKANNTVDLITGKTSEDKEGDWRKLEEYLRHCYGSIEQERNIVSSSK